MCHVTKVQDHWRSITWLSLVLFCYRISKAPSPTYPPQQHPTKIEDPSFRPPPPPPQAAPTLLHFYMNPPFQPSPDHGPTAGVDTQRSHDFMSLSTQNLLHCNHENPPDFRPTMPEPHEFQLFPHEEDHSWIYGNSWQRMSRNQDIEPVEFLLPTNRRSFANAANPYVQPLTLDVWGTASLPASPQLELSVQGQVPSSCSTTTDATTQFVESKTSIEGICCIAAEREARVERHREKRKRRQFAKKIRYSSRKAYAERRPRVKGRFVKSTELLAAPEEQTTPHHTTLWIGGTVPSQPVGRGSGSDPDQIQGLSRTKG